MAMGADTPKASVKRAALLQNVPSFFMVVLPVRQIQMIGQNGARPTYQTQLALGLQRRAIRAVWLT
jgi:hypothetical protein